MHVMQEVVYNIIDKWNKGCIVVPMFLFVMGFAWNIYVLAYYLANFLLNDQFHEWEKVKSNSFI